MQSICKTIFQILVTTVALVSCSDSPIDSSQTLTEIDYSVMDEATLSIVGLPESAKVITLAWFPGNADDDPQGIIYDYSDGMNIPAGKLLFLIESEGYETLLARRVSVAGNTVLQANMCELGAGCYGTLEVKDQN